MVGAEFWLDMSREVSFSRDSALELIVKMCSFVIIPVAKGHRT